MNMSIDAIGPPRGTHILVTSPNVLATHVTLESKLCRPLLATPEFPGDFDKVYGSPHGDEVDGLVGRDAEKMEKLHGLHPP